MSGDAVFPIPEPTFLWVHALTYTPLDGQQVEVDDEGKWRYVQQAPVAFTGYLTAPNPRDVSRAVALGIILDAVALAPLGCGITEASLLTASDTVVPDRLAGNYEVKQVRPNLSHLRLLLTRIVGEEWPPNAPGSDVQVQPSTVSGSAGGL